MAFSKKITGGFLYGILFHIYKMQFIPLMQFIIIAKHIKAINCELM